jgi:hypothetical protein
VLKIVARATILLKDYEVFMPIDCISVVCPDTTFENGAEAVSHAGSPWFAVFERIAEKTGLTIDPNKMRRLHYLITLSFFGGTHFQRTKEEHDAIWNNPTPLKEVAMTSLFDEDLFMAFKELVCADGGTVEKEYMNAEDESKTVYYLYGQDGMLMFNDDTLKEHRYVTLPGSMRLLAESTRRSYVHARYVDGLCALEKLKKLFVTEYVQPQKADQTKLLELSWVCGKRIELGDPIKSLAIFSS